MAVRVLVSLAPGPAREAVLDDLRARRPEPLPTVVDTPREAAERCRQEPFDLVVCLAVEAAAVRSAALRAGRAQSGFEPSLVLLERIDGDRLRAVRQPGDPELAEDWLTSALAVASDRRRRARAGASVPPEAAARLAETASSSPAVRELTSQLRRIVATDSTVLLLGETGVGKEWYAQAIHAASPRALGPFVAVDLGAVPESLLEAELFGHTAGAFTGAERGRRGLFELADGGTLFLDEVGELTAAQQAKLLRVLQHGRVRPLGAERELEIDVRVVAATNRDLEQDVADGRFRSDLWYRLAVFPLRLPRLRDRREDLPALARALLADAALRHGRPACEFSPEALARLVEHAWPGNVRELGNVVERAALLADGPRVELEHLPVGLGGRSAESDPSAVEALAVLAVETDEPLELARRRIDERFERRYLEVLLTACDGRVGEVAERAGITPRALYDKLRRLRLDRRAYRRP